MALNDELVPVLKKLRLSGILATSDLRMKEAVDQDLSHGEFLWRVLGDEVARRDGKQVDARLRRASFEGHNRPFAEWKEVFPNATSVVALVDRLVHRAQILTIEGASYRLKEAKERDEARAKKRKSKSARRE